MSNGECGGARDHGTVVSPIAGGDLRLTTSASCSVGSRNANFLDETVALNFCNRMNSEWIALNGSPCAVEVSGSDWCKRRFLSVDE